MSKTKTILIAGGAVSAVLVVVAGVFAFNDFSKAAELKRAVKSDSDKLERFYDAKRTKVFPNAANIKTEEQNGVTLAERFDTLTNLLARGVASDTNANFRIANESVVNSLRDAAPKDEAGNLVVPANFYFGFEKYDPTKGMLADNADVPRLLRQLRLVDFLTREFYKAEVLKIEKISREEFENVAVSESSSRQPRGSRSDGLTLGSVSVNNTVEGAPVPVSRERFGFQFTTRESSLTRLLGQLNAFAPFAVVQSLDFTKIQPFDVVFPSAENLAQKQSAEAPSGINRPPEGNADRIVSGSLREAPVRVVLVVDVYDFTKAE